MGLKTGFNHLQGVESKWALRPRVYQMPIQDSCLGRRAAEMLREFASMRPIFSYAAPGQGSFLEGAGAKM
jgi:hypothetical protein